MNNNYFLLRHGQTIYQEEKNAFNYPSPEIPPVSITKTGEKQVRESVKTIKNKHIDLIFSSDFFRTQQTAKIATEILSLKEINFDKRLRDINLGKMHDRPKKEYGEFFEGEDQRFDKRPDGGESWDDVKKRVGDLIQELERRYSGKNILIVSHGDPLWLLVGVLRGFETDKEFLESRKSSGSYPQTGQLILI